MFQVINKSILMQHAYIGTTNLEGMQATRMRKIVVDDNEDDDLGDEA